MQLDLHPDVERELKEQLAAGADLNEIIRQVLHKSHRHKTMGKKGVGLSGRTWQEIFDSLSPVSDDFMAHRKDLPLQERSFFDT